jgi:hypothetical protein
MLAAALALTLLRVPEAGTAVVLISTDDVLVVAADSKTTRLDGAGSRTTCKIGEAGGSFFVIAGLRQDAAGELDAPRLAADAVRRGGGVAGQAAAFEEAVRVPLVQALREVREIAPDFYRRRQGAGSPFLQVAFFANDEGRPALAIREFVAREGAGGVITLDVRSREVAAGQTALLGETAAMQRYVAANPLLAEMEPGRRALRVLEEAATSAPEHVGLPADVLLLDGSASRWIERQSGCN